MESATPLPGGTVTFLFTDIEEGSLPRFGAEGDSGGVTRLWEDHPEAMRVALARHDALLRTTLQSHGGHVFKSMGDQFCVAFATAPEALAAALTAQRALGSEPWGEVGPVRVRMALHTGAAEQRDGDYFGPPLNRAARLLEAAHGGQVLVSRTTEERVREALFPGAGLRALGSHRLKDLHQPEQIFQLIHLDLPTDFPPLRSLEAFAHNLPARLTTFIGREEAMAQVKQFLATTRLLTLTGSGGCGKTRLALQVAADVLVLQRRIWIRRLKPQLRRHKVRLRGLSRGVPEGGLRAVVAATLVAGIRGAGGSVVVILEAYADGVWLVELAALPDPALVPQTVASALGVREVPARPLTATLGDYLRPKQALLVRDNCEHLLAACAPLAQSLLRACPKLRILASSREGLGIGGEQTYRVSSLSLPDARYLPPLERLHEFEAVQLFADRARLSQASFAVTEANAPAVVQVCERLYGIPLAIELAAARVKALPVEKLNERLDDMFRLLTGGSRTALPRQQTLRALIDWSYDLLSEEERALLRRLSAFAGGWTLEAAEAVCVGEGVEEWEVLDLLTSLVEKSLVLYEEREGEGRYRLLETVRQYARDRLLEAGEAEDVRNRNLEFFLNWAEQRQSLERLEAEHDNLRAALGWSRTQGKGEVGLRLGGALGDFWHLRGYLEEGREHLAGLLALPGAQARTAGRSKALLGAGMLAADQGDYVAARVLLEESVVISRVLDCKPDLVHSLQELGSMALHQGEHGAARALLSERLAIFRELGDRQGIAGTLLGLGLLAQQHGQHRAARALLEESLAISREQGHKPRIVENLEGLAVVAVSQTEPERAARLFGAAEGLREALGAPLPPAERAGHERSVAVVRAALGEAAFAAAWAEGRAMALEEATEFALEE